MKRSVCLISTLLLLGSALAAAEFLLTDNGRTGWKPNAFTGTEPRIKTGATVSPVEGECSPEFMKTAKVENSRVLIDGIRGSRGDTQAFGSWQPKSPYETFVIDLQAPYEVSRATVWAVFGKGKKTGNVEVTISFDGQNYTPAAQAVFPEGLNSGEKEPLGLPLEIPFERPVKARYVKIRTELVKGAYQQVISEVALWGNDLSTAEATAAIAAPEAETLNVTERLLSDNSAGEIFPGSEKKLITGAKITWITDGVFATKSKELLETGSRPNGTSRVLLDGTRTGGPGQAWGHWGGGLYYGTFTVDLQSPYLITRTAIWSQQTKTQGFESFELLLSMDGEKFVSVGSVQCPETLENEKKDYGEKVELKLEKPAMARFLQFRVKKNPGRMQMIISEIAIWGDALPSGQETSAYLPENQRPTVTGAVSGIGSGALKLDWSGFGSASQTKGYRVYQADKSFERIDLQDVDRIGSFDAKTTSMLIYPLTPGEKKYYGITAVYDEGEYPVIKPVAYTPPGPVDCNTFGDMLAINHFWGGGGARHVKRTTEWETVALDLLAETPYKTTRWWWATPAIVTKFYERGIGATSFAGARQYEDGKALGIHLYCSGNEPHLSGIQPEAFAERIRKTHQEMKAVNPANMLYAPTVCLDGRSLDFLEKFYATGAKSSFDVLDLHTYLGNTSEFIVPPGYPTGSPEALFERMEKIREIMKRHGDGDKPITSTEFGYTDVNVANPAGYITPQRKAEYLVRGLILHHVLGFRRVFVYSFWDEGDDKNYTEHFFGLVDYEMQKKPAYYASVTLGKMLGTCVLEGKIKGSTEVDFGYVYKNAQEGKFITTVWNGASEMSGTFRTTPGTVTVTDLYGEKKQIKTLPDGSFRMVYGPALLYIESTAPTELLKTIQVKNEPSSDRVTLTIDSPVVVTGAGSVAKIEAQLHNPTQEQLQVKVTLETAEGKILAEQSIALSPGAKRPILFPIPASQGLILDRCDLAINYEGKYESRSGRETIFIRRLADKAGIFTAKMYGYKNDVYVLADDTLEVTVDFMRGGRILEIYDRRTRANQITVTYDRLRELGSISFYYCIWDEVKAPVGFRLERNTPYRVEKLPNGIVLKAENPGKLANTKTITLGGNGVLNLNIKIDNLSQQNVACSWYMHPEYTIGGEAKSHSDLLTLPLGGKEVQIPYWTGLGDRPTPEFTAGYWKLASPTKKYEIRQDFSLEQFRNPRLWFGIGSCNFEMQSIEGLELAPGKSWTGDLKWTFSTIQ